MLARMAIDGGTRLAALSRKRTRDRGRETALAWLDLGGSGDAATTGGAAANDGTSASRDRSIARR
jgi:hypothetical protein